MTPFFRPEPPPERKRYKVRVRKISGTYRAIWIGDTPIGVLVIREDGFNVHVMPDIRFSEPGPHVAIARAVGAYFERLGRHDPEDLIYRGKDPLDLAQDNWELRFGVRK